MRGGKDDGVRVLRFYHSGRDSSHRLRERALARAGVDVTLVVPSEWDDGGAQKTLSAEPFRIRELPVDRPGDVNRHRFAVPDDALRALIAQERPDVLDVHEEPVSLVAAQILRAAPGHLPVSMYTAQNLDKRFPPPFARLERRAFARADALYPCSRQAAAVARGKGFAGQVRVLPLGFDDAALRPGSQSLDDGELVLTIVGRLVPEKGVVDAVDVLARVRRERPARLVVVGRGPEEDAARARAVELGVEGHVEVRPWADVTALAEVYRGAHVVLLPSRSTPRWVEQFGRVIVEGHAAGAVVVGYASGSIPEVIGDAGILVPEGDVVSLGEAVAALVSTPERWQALRAAGAALAAERTWDAIAAGMVAMYEEIHAAGHVPRPLPVATPAARAAAVEEFGPPATAGGIARPFALPVLRSSRAATDVLGRLIDVAAAVRLAARPVR
ncbi:glycosyltransferase family 4 protein [Motilibacter aurantiacus]|uniref:glycosyltransferase family 4 protein n=1 Tax=Motilibacter aurantiacus TaxID=2714955 RepID=UPI0014097ADA|nr:glycosyltransferase family 4 protein [Motilibacter aurantiacus]NHC45898.1 glycosyltransferase family 4 protein [Motilibacter aurantiacus]